MSGKLYIVGTPIGNMQDITLRALDTLKQVDVIASEDTRHTRVLLEHFGISKQLISYYKQKERESTEKIINMLYDGKNVALVTDAGMPSISDPGAILVDSIRKEGLDLCVVPGPTAVASAIALAGITDSNGFAFIGFLPEKLKDKDAILDNVKALRLPLVFYVAPHDLKKELEYLKSRLGDRRVWACKEITKMFETVYTGKLSDVVIENEKGEFVIIVDSAKQSTQEELDIPTMLKEKIANGMSKSEAVKSLAKELGISKNAIYAESLNID